MKKILLILFTIHCSLFTAQAQRLIVEKTTVECGRTGFEQPITATFDLRNKGRKKLIIESVKPDCGCTAVEYPKEVGSGSKFQIKMTYDARQLGHFHKMAAIKSNGSKDIVYLTMKGVVIPEMVDYSGDYPIAMSDLLLDSNELFFDDVNKGDQPVQEIHIFNNGTKPMEPRVMHLPPYLTATVSAETLPPSRGATIAVTLHSDKLRDYGLTQTSVYIGQQLGEKVSPDNEVPVSAILLPDLKSFATVNKDMAPQLAVSSTEVDFTDFAGKSKKTEDIVFINNGQSTLTFSSMQMSTGGLKITLGKRDLEPGQSTTLKITGYASDLAKIRKRPRILLITNDPTHAKVIINIKVSNFRANL